MKRLLFVVAGLTAVLASCSREEGIVSEKNTTRRVLIQAGISDDTRTSVTIADGKGTYSWDASESIAVFEAESVEPLTFEVVDQENGLFEGDAENDLVGAVSPVSALGEDSFIHTGSSIEYKLVLSGEYAYENGTNAVLVAAAPTETESAGASLQKFSFRHAAGLIAVTYANLPYGTAGFRFSTDKPIVGEYDLETLENVVLTTPETGSGTAYVMFAHPISNEQMNQPFTFYVPVPVNKTNEHYTGMQIALVDNAKNDIGGTVKKMSAKTFTVARGEIVRFPAVELPEAEEGEAGYVRISNTDDLSNGQYLIVYEGGNVAFNGGLETLSAANNTIVVTPSDGKIGITSTTTAAEFTLTKSGDNWTIKSASGKFMGRENNSNGIDENTETTYLNTIFFTDNDVDIVGSGGAYLRFNSNAGQKRFSYYKSSTYTNQKAIQLYKKLAAGPVGSKLPANLSLNPVGPYTVTAGEDEAFESPVVNPNHLPLTYTFETSYTSAEENDYLAFDTTTGEIMIDENTPAGSIDVTVSFAGSSVYEAQTLNYEINVVAPIRTIAALKDLITGTEKSFDIVLTDAIVTWASGNNAFIQDATAGIYVYNGGANLTVKDKLSGSTTVKAKLYNGWREISAVTGAALSTLKVGTVDALPLDESNTLQDVYDDLTGDGVPVTENWRSKISLGKYKVSGSSKYITSEDGETELQLYTVSGVTLSCTNGDLLDYVIGYPRFYSNKAQIYVVSADDVVTRATPVISLSNLPTGDLSVAEQEITVNYSVANPISGSSVTASTEADWMAVEAGNGTITILVESNNTGYTAARSGVVTVSYPFAVSQTFTVTQSGNSYAITYATVTGGTLSGPARAKQGETVNLTATPTSSSYTFNEDWTVTPSVSGVSVVVTNNAFEMPASDVVVSGSFTSNGGGGDVKVLEEDFSSITAGNSTSTSGSGSAWDGNDNFPTVSTAYKAGGAIRLGSGSGKGSIESKTLNLSNSFTVSFDVKGWTNVEGSIKITVGSQDKTISYTAKMSDSFESKSVDFDAATNNATVKIETTAKRAFLDNIVIVRHD